MNIFQIENNIVVPTPQALLIKDFKTIWDRDKSKKKEQAIKEFSYIEFMSSYQKNNPFINYEPFMRHRKICEHVFGDPKYIPDAQVKKAQETYEEIQNEGSVSLRFYKSLVTAVEKLIKFAEDVDLTARDNRGSAVYTPAHITQITSKAYDTLKQLSLMETKVQQDLYESSKTRGNREINHFEIGPDEVESL
jgi:hypothetical protein